ncbi:DUF397 domain-containing protein [Streptomyces sp. ISL-94]|uniref:DUF397 domain-containing protein n=1 Tax=Streptomyces sp. ISL-94 TaxID=2819190 RepID=UPI001BE77DC6|nr:DUF397 domain-containing protein [Streptomyces sp. ISL-94]MBT2478410.1 DUF397 domain-containing protein [Streptomyces sp. ISL-94]
MSAARWRKSSYSDTNGSQCIGIADGFTGVIPVWDSKDPTARADRGGRRPRSEWDISRSELLDAIVAG